MTVLNCSGGSVPESAEYVGRGSTLGNPFVIGPDGSRLEVIEKYRVWLWKQIKSGYIELEYLAGLHGRDIACHCVPKPCHGHVVELAVAWACDVLRRRLD